MVIVVAVESRLAVDDVTMGAGVTSPLKLSTDST
jgi:hypothetical protein